MINVNKYTYFLGEDGCHREDQTEDSEKKKISNCHLFLIMSENNLHNLQLCIWVCVCANV